MPNFVEFISWNLALTFFGDLRNDNTNTHESNIDHVLGTILNSSPCFNLLKLTKVPGIITTYNLSVRNLIHSKAEQDLTTLHT